MMSTEPRAVSGRRMDATRARPEPKSGLHWHAVYCRSRHERRVGARIETLGLEVYLPVVTRISRWHDRTKAIQWPMFPGYVFVRCAPGRRAEVAAVAGVVQLLRQAGRPAVIPEVEMETIRRVEAALRDTGAVPASEPLIAVGEKVRVTEGPFRGVVGQTVEIRGGRCIIQVGIEAIGQGLRIELDQSMVRPAAGSSHQGGGGLG